jgi:hypothetical protein
MKTNRKLKRNEWLTTDEALTELECHRSTLYRLPLKRIKNKGRTYWNKADVKGQNIWA